MGSNRLTLVKGDMNYHKNDLVRNVTFYKKTNYEVK